MHMEKINWHEEPLTNHDTQKPLGRMLVPVGEPQKEEPIKKRRRQKGGYSERQRLIIHVVILVLLLAFIVFGLIYFLHDGQKKGVPLPDEEQVDSL